MSGTTGLNKYTFCLNLSMQNYNAYFLYVGDVLKSLHKNNSLMALHAERSQFRKSSKTLQTGKLRYRILKKLLASQQQWSELWSPSFLRIEATILFSCAYCPLPTQHHGLPSPGLEESQSKQLWQTSARAWSYRGSQTSKNCNTGEKYSSSGGILQEQWSWQVM